jgi:hypothetical protein
VLRALRDGVCGCVNEVGGCIWKEGEGMLVSKEGVHEAMSVRAGVRGVYVKVVGMGWVRMRDWRAVFWGSRVLCSPLAYAPRPGERHRVPSPPKGPHQAVQCCS